MNSPRYLNILRGKAMSMLDPVDAALVDLLQANGRTSQAEIARTLRMAPSAVLERIRKLEARGVITGYAALIDPRAIDRTLLAFVAVRTAGLHGDEKAGQELAAIPEVLEVHHVAGEDCFLLKVRARDTEHLGVLLRTRISAIESVSSTRTTIVLGTVKESSRLSVPGARGEAEAGRGVVA